MNQEKYIGMDVHQATISVAVMDAGGKLIMECLLETRRPRSLSSSKDCMERLLDRAKSVTVEKSTIPIRASVAVQCCRITR